jgi:hypothetical protein
MSQSASVLDGIRTHRFREYEFRTQSVRLHSSYTSDLYWDVLGSNLGWVINCPDQGFSGFPDALQANDGIDTKSVHSSFRLHAIKFMMINYVPFWALCSLDMLTASVRNDKCG